jgi:broad specificity phosphatase PhoE
VTLVGPGKPLDPRRLARVFVSPRKRARKTFELLVQHSSSMVPIEKVEATTVIAEWDYGDYEGLKAEEIREKRGTKGLDSEREWNIWSDGCEGGESVAL